MSKLTELRQIITQSSQINQVQQGPQQNVLNGNQMISFAQQDKINISVKVVKTPHQIETTERQNQSKEREKKSPKRIIDFYE